jgi:hypothetical protein
MCNQELVKLALQVAAAMVTSPLENCLFDLLKPAANRHRRLAYLGDYARASIQNDSVRHYSRWLLGVDLRYFLNSRQQVGRSWWAG